MYHGGDKVILLQDLDMAVPATDSPDVARESALDKLRRVAEGLEEELFVAEAMRHEAEVRLSIGSSGL